MIKLIAKPVLMALCFAAVSACETETSSSAALTEYKYVGPGPLTGTTYPSSNANPRTSIVSDITTSLCKQIDADRPISLTFQRRKSSPGAPGLWEFECFDAAGFTADPRTKIIDIPVPLVFPL